MKYIYFLATLFMSSAMVAQTYNVTFQVDMSQQTGFTTPEVNGSFNNWCGSCAPMADPEGDGIWTLTIPLAAGSYEYKFSADTWGSQETLLQGTPCTVTNFGFTNRTLSVTADTTLPLVCWGSCTDCASTPNVYDITFQLDMNGQTGFTTPEVNGTFNGWCGNCTAMTDVDGDNIWQITVNVPEGPYEYKFSADNWNTQENLAAGSSCTVTADQFTNRFIDATQDTILPAVCWGSCSPCGQSTGPYNITFNVDMSQAGFAFTTPELNGTFNNWCGSCAPMSDPEGDGIWSITIPLDAGVYTYKFSYDNWTGQENLPVGASCTFSENGFTNRTITVTEATALTNVCWESCEACVTSVANLNNDSFSIYPNPAHSEISINGTISGQKFELRNSLGQIVNTFVSNGSTMQMDVSNMSKGVYFFFQIEEGKVSNTKNFVVE